MLGLNPHSTSSPNTCVLTCKTGVLLVTTFPPSAVGRLNDTNKGIRQVTCLAQGSDAIIYLVALIFISRRNKEPWTSMGKWSVRSIVSLDWINQRVFALQMGKETGKGGWGLDCEETQILSKRLWVSWCCLKDPNLALARNKYVLPERLQVCVCAGVSGG